MRSLVISFLALAAAAAAEVAVPPGPYATHPDAVVDLATVEGTALVEGEWRVLVSRIEAVDHYDPGPYGKASGAPNRTADLTPRPDVGDFDRAPWQPIAATTLDRRRGNGKLSFVWYRIDVTIPERIGAFDPTGSTVVFEIVVDDYAEVWVDGRQPVALGRSGGPFAAGFNAPNRLVVARDAQPGRRIGLAVLGVNAPLSAPPGNFIWVRSATLDFYTAARSAVGVPVETRVERLDPALDAIVPTGATLERVASGFEFVEGPVWHPDGHLLFSDPNANRIYRWSPDGELSVARVKSGYSGVDVGEYRQPGSNGLGLDAEGRLTLCEHGRRRVSRIEKNGAVTVLADRFEGRRLNSPNDLVHRGDGLLCFTDPPFGLPGLHADPRRELDFEGVYCLRDGKPVLVTRELRGPNGLVWSPDGKHLYVTNWDEQRKVVMRYRENADGSFAAGEVFFDMTAAPDAEALDGIEVDAGGNLYVSGPGGLWVISPAGKHLGTVRGPELAANFAWGDDDRRTLYWTARTGLYRIRLGIPGA